MFHRVAVQPRVQVVQRVVLLAAVVVVVVRVAHVVRVPVVELKVMEVATEALEVVVAGRLSSALVVLARVLRKVRALAEEPATPLGVRAARQDREHRGGLGAVEQVVPG